MNARLLSCKYIKKRKQYKLIFLVLNFIDALDRYIYSASGEFKNGKYIAYCDNKEDARLLIMELSPTSKIPKEVVEHA